MRQSGGSVVMTIPYDPASSSPSQFPLQHHVPPPNFSRPQLNSNSPSNGIASGGLNGNVLGSKPSDGMAGTLPHGRPTTQSTTTSRISSVSHNATPERDSKREAPRPNINGTVDRPTSSENSYFPPVVLNGSAKQSLSTSPVGVPVSEASPSKNTQPIPTPTSSASSHAPMANLGKTVDLLSTPHGRMSPSPSPAHLSAPPALSTIPSASSTQPNPSQLRHRHTLQVPRSHNNRTSTGSGSDAIASGRFSPTTTGPPRRASITLGRKPTRSINSENHLEEIPPDEDAARWAEAIKAKRASKRRKQEEEEDDKVVVGTKVDHNHANWVTAYNMLTGIRFVVSRVNAKMDRPLTDSDFDAKHKFSFDITGNELTPSAKYDFKFKDYSPWVFRHLRMKFGLDPADYLMSLTSKYILSELGSPGKSGSFFYFSRDYKYIIKTIHHAEHKFLRRILRDYYRHVEENPNTLISQFYGLHRVKTPFGRKIHFVVMNNLFPPHRDIHQTFDLKGSTIGRDFKEENLAENPRATLKDLNWLRRDMNLNFGPRKSELFIQQVERDVKLLQRLGIMDYSLLIGIHDLTRGNRDDIRNSALKVFEPGGSENDDLHGHMLQRTPSKMEKARQARELRQIVNKQVPVSLDRTSNRLPDEFSEQKNTIFYGDDGGFRATHENDQPGDVIYYLGIIDCLTHYGFVKQLENFWRGLSNPKDQISAIPPVSYGERFFKFITGLVKTPEAVEREKRERENTYGVEEQPAEHHGGAGDNEVLQRAIRQAEMTEKQGANERDRPVARSIVPVRSPSAERTGGVAGAVLPVVEEVGEGSMTGLRSLSRSGSASDSGRHSGYAESGILQRGPVDVEGFTHTRGDRGFSEVSTPISFTKHDPDDFAVRVTRVSS